LTTKALPHRPVRFLREIHPSCESWVNPFDKQTIDDLRAFLKPEIRRVEERLDGWNTLSPANSGGHSPPRAKA
jgi:hypothetical protein